MALAKLLAAGSLDAVRMPVEPVGAMRGRLARRSELVSARSRVKNEVHAVLVGGLKGRPPASDLFGGKGQAWLGELQLPAEERETVDTGLRQIAFLVSEIAEVERLIALHAMRWPQIGRLMSVPGVNLIVAATLLAAAATSAASRTPTSSSATSAWTHGSRQSGDQPAKHAYRRNVADWQATRPTKAGASATQGHASKEPSKG